jgi:hypothetical protein
MATETKVQWTDLTGRQKQFCNQNGIAQSEYLSKLNQGKKWCTGCKSFHDKSKFSSDKSRFDGLISEIGLNIHQILTGKLLLGVIRGIDVEV